MKRLALASVLVSVGAFGACAVEEPVANDDGGATGGASGVSGASGTPSGGASGTPSGGASGTPSGGASGTPSGGVSGTPSGGVSGTPSGGGGGADPTGGIGGAAPTGGVGGDLLGGMGGTPTTGGMGGTPTTGGMGGGGMAGMLMGGMGGGGKAGGGGSGGGKAGCPSVAELFPTSGNLGSFDGRLVTTPCAPTSSDDCNGGGWVYNGVTTRCMGNLTAQQDFMVGGTPGTTYQVTIHFYGIMEPKNYTGTGITREAGTTRPTNSNTGATPVPWASTTSAGAKSFPLTDYNTYEIHVLDNNMMVNRQYFLNSDTAEGHWTYVINYEKTIPVIGGGRMRVRTYDNNCRMIKNCYDGSQGSFAQCGARARSITAVNNAMPPPGAALVQPGLGQATDQSGQWMYTDVVSVTCQ